MSRIDAVIRSFARALSGGPAPSRTHRTLLTLVAVALAAAGTIAISHLQAQASANDAHSADLAAAARQPCFGAAARDPRRVCDNPKLRYESVPTPRLARTLPNTACDRTGEHPGVCEFGTPARRAQQTIALVGDSHAGHWRGAVERVAKAHGWHGMSLTHTSCPLSKAVRHLPTQARFAACVQWKREVFAWFQQHPEIHTVFVAGLSGGTGVFPSHGRSQYATSVAGYLAAWRALPATVRHIVVIRDTPKVNGNTGSCVSNAVAAHRSPGLACAVLRSNRLDADPLVSAAHRLRSSRVQVADMTRYFCGPRYCYPVIGGALVFRDVNHMTAVYSTSMGPYLLRSVNRLMRNW